MTSSKPAVAAKPAAPVSTAPVVEAPLAKVFGRLPIVDAGYADNIFSDKPLKRGFYDILGQGVPNDYCRYIGDGENIHFACQLSDGSNVAAKEYKNIKVTDIISGKSPEPFVALSQFKDAENVDYPGYDIKMLDTKDPETCAKACIDTPNCNLFITSTDSNQCWLKTELGPRQPQIKNRNTYVKNSYVAAPVVQLGSNGWSLVKGIPIAVRINQNGDLECASTNGRDCLWRGSDDEVLADINNPSFNASAPLICGEDHKSKWGGIGYDNVNHWCHKAMSQLNPASPRINPMPASFVRYTRNYGNYLQY